MREPVAHQSRRFETTHWSLVAQAGEGDGEEQREALGALVTRYLPALRSHLTNRKRMKAHDADDLLQEFLATKVLAGGLVSEARRERGRFRSFLLTALDHFAISQLRRDQAQKRSTGMPPLPADEELDAPDPSQGPDEAFNIEWARNLLSEVLRRMSDECDRTGRADVWGVFEARLLGPMLNSTSPQPYERLVERFSFESPAQASNVLITAKRMFERIIRSVIGQYEFDEKQVEQEINDLRKILSQAKT